MVLVLAQVFMTFTPRIPSTEEMAECARKVNMSVNKFVEPPAGTCMNS